MGKEAVVVEFKALCWHLSGETEESREARRDIWCPGRFLERAALAYNNNIYCLVQLVLKELLLLTFQPTVDAS